MKENLIRCVDLIGKSLHPAHLKTDKFTLHRREELLGHMQAYVPSVALYIVQWGRAQAGAVSLCL